MVCLPDYDHSDYKKVMEYTRYRPHQALEHPGTEFTLQHCGWGIHLKSLVRDIQLP